MNVNYWSTTPSLFGEGEIWAIPEGATDVIVQNYPHPSPKVTFPASLQRLWIDCESFMCSWNWKGEPINPTRDERITLDSIASTAQLRAFWDRVQSIKKSQTVSVECNLFMEAPMSPSDALKSPDLNGWPYWGSYAGADAHGVHIDDMSPVVASNRLRAVLRRCPNIPIALWMRADSRRESFFRGMLFSRGNGMCFDPGADEMLLAKFKTYQGQMEAVLKDRTIVQPSTGELQSPTLGCSWDSAKLSDGSTLVRATCDRPFTPHIGGVAVSCRPDDGEGCWREFK